MLEGISNLNPTLAGFKLHQDIKTWPILCQKTYIVHPLIALDNIDGIKTQDWRTKPMPV